MFERYVRDCVMVARFGTCETRTAFVEQYEFVLGGVGLVLRGLSDEEQEEAFLDAMRMREGGLPRTSVGLRLALPRWFSLRVDHPLGAWEEALHFMPTGLAIDPVCGMCVDPGSTPYQVVEDGNVHSSSTLR
ncbi:MAG TPA: hypothetical protein VFE20_03950 [Thermoleophilia bacterium]|nr:hypothetical protein [Thermoleophilia bacterium]